MSQTTETPIHANVAPGQRVEVGPYIVSRSHDKTFSTDFNSMQDSGAEFVCLINDKTHIHVYFGGKDDKVLVIV